MAPVSTKAFILVHHVGFCYKSERRFGHLTHTHKLQRHFGLTLAIHGSFPFHHFAGACLMEQGLHLFGRGRAIVLSHGRMKLLGFMVSQGNVTVRGTPIYLTPSLTLGWDKPSLECLHCPGPWYFKGFEVLWGHCFAKCPGCPQEKQLPRGIVLFIPYLPPALD